MTGCRPIFASSRMSLMSQEKHMRSFAALALLAVLLTACAPAAPTPDLNAQMTQAVQTAIVSIQQTQTAVAHPAVTEAAQAPVPTAAGTVPVLAPTFTTSLLQGAATPHTYVQDSCEYLKDKWSSQNAAPGTIVMVIMFHSISKGSASASNEISVDDFKKLM